VAEMLRLLVGYARGSGVDARWVVIDGTSKYFAVTKRLHNRLHGAAGDDGQLGPQETALYRAVLEDNAATLHQRVEPGDIVMLHDPQTAGLARQLADRGAHVVWRCHIGTDRTNAYTREAWDFLIPHLSGCSAFVFSRTAYVPPELTGSDVWIIEPSIDPMSPKNRLLPRARMTELLTQIGLLDGPSDSARHCVLGGAGSFSPNDRLVLQVSRWDPLKDMLGVMRGFSEYVAGPNTDAKLALIGPSVESVADDPEAGARRMSGGLGCASTSSPQSRPARGPPHARRRRQRARGKRCTAPRQHRGAKEPARGLRVDDHRSDVEIASCRRLSRRWHRGSDATGCWRTSEGSKKPRELRQHPEHAARSTR